METTTLRTPAQVRAFLEVVGTPAPSLHPHIGSDDPWKRWNGWNKTVVVGLDAEGFPFQADLHVYAEGGYTSLSAARVGSIPHGGLKDKDWKTRVDIAFPVEALPAKSVIQHPKHTPKV